MHDGDYHQTHRAEFAMVEYGHSLASEFGVRLSSSVPKLIADSYKLVGKFKCDVGIY